MASHFYRLDGVSIFNDNLREKSHFRNFSGNYVTGPDGYWTEYEELTSFPGLFISRLEDPGNGVLLALSAKGDFDDPAREYYLWCEKNKQSRRI